MKKFQILLSLFIILGQAVFSATKIDSIPNPKTNNAHSYVSNPDGILSYQTCQEINQILDSLSIKQTVEVAVVAVNSIGDKDLESFSNELFNKWGIGKKENNNGMLILLVLDRHRVRLEPGGGLEGVLPDAICKRIETQEMIPYFKQNNYDAGILAGVQKIAETVNAPETIAVEKPIDWNVVWPMAGAGYVIFLLLPLLWMGSVTYKIKQSSDYSSNLERYKSLKLQKTSIVSLFAIILPVFLALGVVFFVRFEYLVFVLPMPLLVIPTELYGRIVMVKARRAPMSCNVCDGTMHLLSEKEEDAHLKLAQQFEEQLKAVDYDVFVCDKCANEAIFTLDKPSAYKECPKCNTKAFILKERKVTVEPTYFNSGNLRLTYHCEFCGYEEDHNERLPRSTGGNGGSFIAGAAVGSIFSGSGGFSGGGGGFSGGGSFGGGFSGGGGASSGW
jgi:uncharacterized protein